MFHIIHFTLFAAIAIVESRKYFVNINRIDTFNSSTDDGTLWNVAFPSLENAFAAILLGSDKSAQIYLWEGIYKPDPSVTRDACFIAPKGVQIYGGFTDKSQRTDIARPLDTFSTISGDIGNENDQSDNCYHVLTYNKKLTLDRVIIANGNANYNEDDSYTNPELALHRFGGGLIAFDSDAIADLNLNQVYFINNTAIAGGALWFSANPNTDINVIIKYCIFDNNKALAGQYDGGYGGAIYFYFLANLNIEDTNFTNNYADYRGGAIYLDYGGILDVSGSYFINNKAGGYGGAIFSEDRNSQTNGTFPMIETSYFIENTATLYGGAICYINYVQGTIIGNTFNGNTADVIGGGIALFNSTVDGYDFNTFINNVATYDTTTNDLFWEPNEVEFDDINDWPAIADIDNYWTQLQDVWGHNQQELGEEDPVAGLRYADGSTNGIHYCFVDWASTHATPTGNKWQEAYTEIQPCLEQLKSSGGGEIWVAGGGTYKPTTVPQWKKEMLAAKQLPTNQANERSFEMYDNIAMYGGFQGNENTRNSRNPFQHKTYLSGDLGVLSNGKQTYANQLLMSADNTIIDGFIFISAGYGPLLMGGNRRRRLKNSISVQIVLDTKDPFQGAGIYANSTNVLIQNSIFYRLFAGNKGGAIYCIGQEGDSADEIFKYPTLKNVAFIENRANLRGGAISADVGCDFECKWCIFDGNACAQKGGAIYLDFEASPLITKSTFINNNALGAGGCIAADGRSMASIEDTTFRNNSALWEGGCLYSGSGVGSKSLQGYNIGAFDINIGINDVFGADNDINANKLLQNHVGFNNMYGWPMSTLSVFDSSQSPTPKPSTSPIVQGVLTDIPQPNFVIFIVDDMVYTQALGNRIDSPFFPIPDKPPSSSETIIDITLPNIEEFIHSSVVFPRTYSGPKCSPSRFAVLTGRSPAQSKYAMTKSYTASPYDLKGIEGTKVTVPFSRISQTTTDAIYNIPAVLTNDGYVTGMIGKWHLMDKDDYPVSPEYCDALNNGGADDPTADIPYIYAQCTSVVKELGFSFVDGYFHSNIETNDYYTHNPEWMQYQVRKFIEVTKNNINADKPYFLYIAPTLTHDPSILDALTRPISQTPAGNTFGNDLTSQQKNNYIYRYMKTREEILAEATAWQALDGSSDEDTLNKAAGLLWVDEQFGALLRSLSDKGKDVDNTMIILINDHGMGAKGLLYEEGTRIMQSVAYPNLFGPKWWMGHQGYVLPHDFITSTMDYANVIFTLAQIQIPDAYYTQPEHFNRYMWLDDVLDYIYYIDQGRDDEYYSSVLPNMECCTNRTIDVYNSHAIVTKKYKYLYRATSEIESVVTPKGIEIPSPEASMYSNSLLNNEQYYDLEFDSSEQNNLINNSDINININSSLGITLFLLKIQMVNYIIDESCLADSIPDCELPQIIDIPNGYEYQEQTPSPTYYGYTCQRFVEYSARFTGVEGFREARDGWGYRNKTQIAFLKAVDDSESPGYGNECGTSFEYDETLGKDVPNGIEYLYNFTKSRQVLDLEMRVCCMGTFGEQYPYDPSSWLPNEVLQNKYPSAFHMDDILDTQNGIGIKAIVVINVLCFICVICICIGIGFFIYKKKQNEYQLKINELNLVINNNINNNQKKVKEDKLKKDTITKQQKKGIEMAGYNEMESSRDSDNLSDIESQQIDSNNKAINKTVAEATGGLSPVPGSPPEVIVTTNNTTNPY